MDAPIDRVDEAIAELRAAIALEPRQPALGRLLTLRGDKASADSVRPDRSQRRPVVN